MIRATTDELLAYLADLVEEAERYGAAVETPDGEEPAWVRTRPDLLVMRLAIHPPVAARQGKVEIELREHWIRTGRELWDAADYGYELRDEQVGYRRALHRHHPDRFIRAYDVATHEHCEVPIGRVACGHYAGVPLSGAIDGLRRLYGMWLEGRPPDCAALRCLS